MRVWIVMLAVLLLSSCESQKETVVYQQSGSGATPDTASVSTESRSSVVAGQESEDASTFIGSMVNPQRSRSGSRVGSSPSKSSDGDGILDLDVPDQSMKQDSGFHNNFVDLYVFTEDERVLRNELSFSLVKQSNLPVASCKIDFGRYVDCTAQPGKSGYSEVTVRVSDGRDAYDDLFVVSVIGEADNVDEEDASVGDDGADNEQLSANRPPVLSPVSDQMATVGQPFSLSVSASDSDGDTIVISDNSGLFEISSSGLIQFVPAAAGSHLITITASDGSLKATRSFTITIAPVVTIPGQNKAPVIASVGRLLATVGTHFDFTIAASDAQGESITFSDNSALFAIGSTSGVISFLPDEGDAGTHTITITASDGELSSSVVLLLHIQAADEDEVIEKPEKSPSPFGSLKPTNSWASYYGSLTITGVGVSVGDQVAAFDKSGNLAGKFVITTPGNYGFLHVYADDIATTRDEGMATGESITFKVWDKSTGKVSTIAGPGWVAQLEPLQLDLNVS